MTKRILHVSHHPEGKAPSADVLRGVLDRAPAWVEYAPRRWLIWTSLSTPTWYRRFRDVVGKEDNLLIFPVELNEYEGSLPKIVWGWLRKYSSHDAKADAADAVVETADT